MNKVKIVQIAPNNEYLDSEGRVWRIKEDGLDYNDRPRYKWVQLDLPEEPGE